jgi:enoyl-CoA hydratase/carnithine racemase
MTSTSAKTPAEYKTLLYSTDISLRCATITLNRPKRLNAIDDVLPLELRDAVGCANADPDVSVIVLQGAGRAFCAGYDLQEFAQSDRIHPCSQPMPWDPYIDFKFMSQYTRCFMSLFHSLKPTICKVHGYAVAGGSDIALCCDIVIMEDTARIGYPPTRVWGCPTTAMWYSRVGMVKAKELMLTGETITGSEAKRIGLINEAVATRYLDATVLEFVKKIGTVPVNQLFFQKQVINNAIEMNGLGATQRLATVFDGMTRHSPEGIEFQSLAQHSGFHTAIRARDSTDTAFQASPEQVGRNHAYHGLIRSRL